MFFQSIGTMMTAGTDLSINIRKVGGQLVVSTLPRNNNLKEEAQSYLIPLMVTGTPMELDAGFLQAILQPIQKAGGLLINLEQFEKQAEATAAKAKSEKPKADKEANEGKEKRENYEKCLKKADELTAVKRYSEALTYLKQAKTFATAMQQTDLAKKIRQVEQEMKQGSLFGAEEIPQIQPSRPQQPVQQQMPQPVMQPQQAGQPVQQRPVRQPAPMQQPEQPIVHQQQQGEYYQQGGQSLMQPSQPMQQPVIHPARFSVTADGQPAPHPMQQTPAEQSFFGQEDRRYRQQPRPIQNPAQRQPAMQPEYIPAPWGEKEENDATGFCEDPYAGYPDFPEECRMRDETQLAAIY